MPITKTAGVVVETAPAGADVFQRTGDYRADQFRLMDKQDWTKQIGFDASALSTATTLTIKASASNTGTLTLPAVASGTLMDVTQASPPVTYNAPANGATITLTANTTNATTLVIEPAGTIAGATIVLPTAPADGYVVRFSSTAIITTLTITAGGADTIVSTVASLIAGAFGALVYVASTAKWYRVG